MEVAKHPNKRKFFFDFRMKTFCLTLLFLINFANTAYSQHIVQFQQGLDEDLSDAISPSLSRRKRDSGDDEPTTTESETNDPKCKAQMTQFDSLRTKIKNGEKLETTHVFANETKFNLALAWASHDDGGVLLVLTSDRKLFMKSQSTLWRSTDNGRTWKDWNDHVDDEVFRQQDGLQRNPKNPEKVYLISYQHFIYKSENKGETWTKVEIVKDEDSKKLVALDEQLEFHTEYEDFVLVISNERKLYVTYTNFGADGIKEIKDDVRVVKWGTSEQKGERSHAIYATTGKPTNPFMSRSTPYYRLERYDHEKEQWTTILERVASYDVQGKFMHASIYKTDKPMSSSDEKVMMISSDGGDTWDEVQLPTLTGDRFYSVLDMTEGLIFMHVDNPGDTGHGILYTSGEKGIEYSESLTNHLFPNFNTVHDFYKVKSIRGVYLTSQMAEDKSIHSVITFDKGGEWQSIKKPSLVECETKDKNNCYLQIHGGYSIHRGIQAKQPHSLEAAKGLVLVHGHAASNLQTTAPDVYLSNDGGYNFKRVLRGPHAYEIIDSGGLIVAVPIPRENPYAKVIKFSFDEGNCWHVYKFTNEDIKFTGLLTEPGGRSATISIWGYTKENKKWTINVIDFATVIIDRCKDIDYDQWIPHQFGKNKGCLMGVKERFSRLKPDSMCLNGYFKQTPYMSEPCECTKDDYECDFGFYRPPGSEDCVRQPEIQAERLEICKGHHVEQIVTVGYRKIPGNLCKGGFQPIRKEVKLNEVCKSIEVNHDKGENVIAGSADKQAIVHDFEPKPENTGGGSAVVAAIIIVLVVVVLGVGVFFGYKYILLRRHKQVYRYSMLSGGPGDEVENALMGHDTLFDDDDEADADMAQQAGQRPARGPAASAAATAHKPPQPQQQQPELRGYHDDSDDDLLA